jgi:hypothetical protein
VDYLRAHSECVLVGCRVWYCDAEGDPLYEFPTLGDHEAIDAFHFQMRGPALIHPSVMMRRDAVLAVGRYRDFSIAEEVDLFLRLAEHGRLARKELRDQVSKWTADWIRSLRDHFWLSQVLGRLSRPWWKSAAVPPEILTPRSVRF